MTVVSRDYTWGDALVVAAFKSPGGVNVAVKAIREQVGPQIGVRNTFAKLLHVKALNDLDGRDRLRAWLLLVAFGQEPTEWGLSDDDVPRGLDRDELRRILPLCAARESNPQPAD